MVGSAIAGLSAVGPDDSVEQHVADTLWVSAGLGDRQVAQQLFLTQSMGLGGSPNWERRSTHKTVSSNSDAICTHPVAQLPPEVRQDFRHKFPVLATRCPPKYRSR